MQLLKNAIRLSSAFVLAAVLGCTSSPTEPAGGGGTITPKPPDPVVTFTVTVTANPSQITAGGTASSNITVDVRRSDNGQPPPDLTTVTLTTNLGGFGSAGGPQSVELQTVNGRVQAVLFAGTDTGTATVHERMSRSSGPHAKGPSACEKTTSGPWPPRRQASVPLSRARRSSLIGSLSGGRSSGRHRYAPPKRLA